MGGGKARGKSRSLVPRPHPSRGEKVSGNLVEFLGILNVSGRVTITYSDPLAQRAGGVADPTAR